MNARGSFAAMQLQAVGQSHHETVQKIGNEVIDQAEAL